MLNLILLEDNPADYTLFKILLKELGVQNTLRVFSSGDEIIKYLCLNINTPGEYPSGVVLDLNIPRKNGHEVLSWIKSKPELAKIPVAVLSSSKNKDDISKVEKLHAHFFSKSGELEDMKSIIKDIVILFG